MNYWRAEFHYVYSDWILYFIELVICTRFDTISNNRLDCKIINLFIDVYIYNLSHHKRPNAYKLEVQFNASRRNGVGAKATRRRVRLTANTGRTLLLKIKFCDKHKLTTRNLNDEEVKMNLMKIFWKFILMRPFMWDKIHFSKA